MLKYNMLCHLCQSKMKLKVHLTILTRRDLSFGDHQDSKNVILYFV